MTGIKLKPCPLCNGSAVYKTKNTIDDFLGTQTVSCRECCASAPLHNWNNRTHEDCLREDNHNLQIWFGLSRSSFCVLPRVLMESMPNQWQEQMAELLHQYDEAFDTDLGIDSISVTAKRNGKFCKLPDFITNYRHPDIESINSIRNNHG